MTPAKRALMGLVVSALLWVFLELVLSVAGTPSAYRRDALGGWQVNAGLSNHRMHGMQEPHDFVMSTNPDGLRTTHTLQKEPDVLRIALMGDSNVFGWGVDDAETLSARLEMELHELGRVDVEVINAGQPGHSTTQMRWLFEEVLARYQPDLVLLVPTLHDHNLVHVSDAEILDGPGGLAAAVRVFLARHSRVYAWLLTRVSPMATEPQLLPGTASSEPRVNRVTDTERTENFERVAQGLNDWGGSLSLALLPFYADLQLQPEAPVVDRIGLDWLKAYGAQTDVSLYDVRSCCGPGADSLVFEFDQGHLNADGHAHVAKALAAVLLPTL